MPEDLSDITDLVNHMASDLEDCTSLEIARFFHGAAHDLIAYRTGQKKPQYRVFHADLPERNGTPLNTAK